MRDLIRDSSRLFYENDRWLATTGEKLKVYEFCSGSSAPSECRIVGKKCRNVGSLSYYVPLKGYIHLVSRSELDLLRIFTSEVAQHATSYEQ